MQDGHTLEYEFFALCPQGLEQLLARELKQELHMRQVRPLKGSVSFFGTQSDGYRVCIWSRIASRILQVFARINASNAEELYKNMYALPWENLIAPRKSIAISAKGTNAALKNTQFSAQKAKDALCDRLREVQGCRPDVAMHKPDVAIWLNIHKQKATVSFDYAGEALHKRGYRLDRQQVEAPLKENLAAALLLWGGWKPLTKAQDANKPQNRHVASPLFADPACGSATLVLEAAMIAADRAPGLTRTYWGFAGLKNFDEKAFKHILKDAHARFKKGIEAFQNASPKPLFLGTDTNARAIEIAWDNACRLGMESYLHFIQADCAELEQRLEQAAFMQANEGPANDAAKDEAARVKSKNRSLRVDAQGKFVDVANPKQGSILQRYEGFIALNPPYGKRLCAENGRNSFSESLAKGLRNLPKTWHMAVITPDDDFDRKINLKTQSTLPTRNGSLEVRFHTYALNSSFLIDLEFTCLNGKEISIRASSNNAAQFAARLRKRAKQRSKWARKQNIGAYRVYDADLPDYSLSIDYFEDAASGLAYVLICEYLAPRDIDPQKAAQRFQDACTVVKALFSLPDERLFTRVRRREKGGLQYRKNQIKPLHAQRTDAAVRIQVNEAGHLFELNLSDYLDTGLFLDHRLTRALIGNLAKETRFLNLFAYTGTATVYAASGGAKETTTVDMSRTYLDWARRNMAQAGFSGAEHRFICADVLQWAEKCNELYDLVFVDPPTFSNSKTMGGRTWDIQRDHVSLLLELRRLLSAGGSLIFSGNLRSFKLDASALEAAGFNVSDISAQTIPEDFARNPRIHFCYVLKNS